MPKENDKWFFRRPDGAEAGPFDADGLRAGVVAGDILAETPVRREGGSFRPAVAVGECGFDCLVLQTEPSLDVLGPFAREYLDRPEITDSLPRDGLFFVKSGTVADAAAVPGAAVGTTGAALVERVLEAERALRTSEKRRRELEAALKAKDLEFEAERAKSAAEISALKADALRRESEVEGLRADAAAGEKRERESLEIQARLVDAEKESAGLDRKLRQADATEAALRRELAESGEKAASAEARASEAEAKAAEAGTKLAEAEAKLAEAAAKASSAEARAAEAGRRAEIARSGAAWLRETLGKTLAEAESRMKEDAAEPVEAEIVVEAPPAAAKGGTADRGASAKGASAPPEDSRTARMAALESQLRKELRMAGAAGGAGKLGSFFKPRK